jgi:HrpA-like RNA helicase
MLQFILSRNYSRDQKMQHFEHPPLPQDPRHQRRHRVSLTPSLSPFLLPSLHPLNPSYSFDFMDPPSEPQMIEGLVMLHMLGAIDGNGDITETGRGMSTFPLEPNLSRMLFEASRSKIS